MGATVIEKHFTINRSDGGVDSSFSLEPNEMKSLVSETKEAFSALGTAAYKRSAVEEKNKVFRRSLYFTTDISKGDIITKECVRRIRPGFGLDAKYYESVIGAKCLIEAKKGDRVTRKHADIKAD